MTLALPRPVSATARTARGYTAIEVLMAMTVMAIGGAAVITMQKTSVTANLDARKADVANAIARTWVERLQRDAMAWTLPGPDGAGTNLATNAPIVGNILASPGQWFLPNQEIATSSPGFDILGRDLPLGALGTADFCVNVRLTWLSQPPTLDLIRADVRVVWPIGIMNSAPGFCNPTTAGLVDPNVGSGAQTDPNGDPKAPVFHTLYVTTSIKENTAI
ncbi:MAG TPA: prepilin-type N-terminal cleavage/methylation domain-containing protein [Polyangiaceae bacterium]|jgi:prepilin-type N-terminal cleavage/methylation domain-containing protein|nr:prepilin-type N-terminal cleavage/methylation domain-containing protein [Polyangiaceae bacterium]